MESKVSHLAKSTSIEVKSISNIAVKKNAKKIVKKNAKKKNKNLKVDFPKFDWEALDPQPVIGVDEVGRGCLAGRVYSAAVILDTSKDISIFKDSKSLSASRREEIADLIIKEHTYALGFATVEEIDSINILQASLLSMQRAVVGVLEREKLAKGHVVVDGTFKVPGLVGLEQTTLIKGDQRCPQVAAGSILAKVTRDNYITELSKKYNQYGFEKHKGYSTKLHKMAIAEFGPCEIHRRTFSGVKEFL